MNHRSLAFRLAVWYTLLLGAVFALVGTGVYFGLEQYLRTSLTDSLRRRSIQVEQILAGSAPNVSDAAIADAIDTRVAPEFNNRFVRVTRAPDALVYRSGAPADRSFDPRSIPMFGGTWVGREVARREPTADGPILISAMRLQTPSGRYLVELGTSLQPLDSLLDRLLGLLGVLLPVLAAFAAAGGYVLVQRALRPVERMAQTAEHISLQHLDARLPVVKTGDALQQLSQSLNHMLTRLRDSVQASRRFVADASHELRTPLTVIKGELQEIVRDAHCPTELREGIGSSLEEVGRLEHLVQGLLVLSRLDAGDAQRAWLDVELGALAANTVEQMRLVAEDRGVQLDASGLAPLGVRGDPGRLKQVIVNLLDNAIKFTPRGGSVRLRSEQQSDTVVLEIEDTGVGIPSTALPHVFERFYRADEARTRPDGTAAGGAGLGLSIVHSICAAHGAEIEVRSTVGVGSCFRLKFPRPSTPVGGAALSAASTALGRSDAATVLASAPTRGGA